MARRLKSAYSVRAVPAIEKNEWQPVEAYAVFFFSGVYKVFFELVSPKGWSIRAALAASCRSEGAVERSRSVKRLTASDSERL